MAIKTTTKSSKTSKASAKTAPKAKAKAKPKPASKAKVSSTPKVKPARVTKAAAAKPAKAPALKKTSPAKKATVKSAAATPARKTRSRESAISGPYQFEPYQTKKNESYMSKEQLAHFSTLLNNWGKELHEGADVTVRHMKDEAAIFPDPLDRAAQEEEFTLELRTRDRERKLIKKIEESLELIEQGEYGFCETCGAEIGIRRLEARPTATLCIDCKTIDEIREKQEIG